MFCIWYPTKSCIIISSDWNEYGACIEDIWTWRELGVESSKELQNKQMLNLPNYIFWAHPLNCSQKFIPAGSSRHFFPLFTLLSSFSNTPAIFLLSPSLPATLSIFNYSLFFPNSPCTQPSHCLIRHYVKKKLTLKDFLTVCYKSFYLRL